jgi:hypothetical protein
MVHVACKGKMRTACEILVGKPEGKRSFGKLRRRRGDNVKIDFKGIGWEVVDWSGRLRIGINGGL